MGVGREKRDERKDKGQRNSWRQEEENKFRSI